MRVEITIAPDATAPARTILRCIACGCRWAEGELTGRVRGGECGDRRCRCDEPDCWTEHVCRGGLQIEQTPGDC